MMGPAPMKYVCSFIFSFYSRQVGKSNQKRRNKSHVANSVAEKDAESSGTIKSPAEGCKGSPAVSPSEKWHDAHGSSTKQNGSTLYELATIVQTTPWGTPVKSKKFPKISQKQRKCVRNSTEAPSARANSFSETDEADVYCSPTGPAKSAWSSPEANSSQPTALFSSILEEKQSSLRIIIDSERRQEKNLVAVRSKSLKITLVRLETGLRENARLSRETKYKCI